MGKLNCFDLYQILQVTSEEGWQEKVEANWLEAHTNEYLRIRTVKSGETICRQGEFEGYLHYVIQGRHIHYRGSREGKLHLVAISDKDDWIGIDRTIAQETANATDNLALEECIVLDIKKEYFIQCIRENGDFSIYIIRHLLNKMSSSSRKSDRMIFYNAREHLMLYILMYWNGHHDGGTECVVRLKNEYIAEEIGVCERTLYRSLKELKESGLIDIRKRNIVVNKAQIQKIIKFF